MNLKKTIPIFTLILFALNLSACGLTPGNPGQPQLSPSSGESLAATLWALVSLGMPGEEAPVIEGSKVTISFEEDWRMGGSGGCNSYGGQYRVEGNSIEFHEIESTLIACTDQAITNQETQYLQALRNASRFTIGDDRLSIYYDNDQNVLHFVQMPAPSSGSTQPPVITDSNQMPNGPGEKQYTLMAEAGQNIAINITSDAAPLSLTITSPSGVQRFPEVSQVDGVFHINHTFHAAETGVYQMTLMKADQTPGTNFTATIMVQ